MNDVLVIGIAGGTGSGKTTLTKQIADQLGDDVTVITHDCYYREHHELTYEERTQLNYDHPDSYETELLVEHLAALRAGESVEIPVYDFSIYDRTDATTTVRPSRVIIVEGILIFASPELRDQMDLKVFVDVDADVRILRRLVRDVRDRGRSVESVVNQYLNTVKPMYDKYIRNYIHDADVIVANGGKNARIVDILAGYVKDELSSHIQQ